MGSGFFKKAWQKDGRGHYANVEVQCYFDKNKINKFSVGQWCTKENLEAVLNELELTWKDFGCPGISLKAIEHDFSEIDTCESSIRVAVRAAANEAMKKFGLDFEGPY